MKNILHKKALSSNNSAEKHFKTCACLCATTLRPDFFFFCCTQQRGYPGKMPGGQLKRPGPPLGEQSVIQHTSPPSLHLSSRQVAEDCPSPSKRKKSSDQVNDNNLTLLNPQRVALNDPK